MTLRTPQVSSEETEVVQGKDLQTDPSVNKPDQKKKKSVFSAKKCGASSAHPLIELLFLLCEDAGDLLGELNEVAHLCQLLTDAGGERAAAGHAVGQLTLCRDT